ncbi:unnamed protein product [Caenorhabditis bovis]|uniref:Uncharacterized protein n=1 Tax=Caenorhabditis bovis TaxID=2654633 RepID=A0A8S1FF98_9PELO|nr:unnamed protein product [Caenorhabditis bovis]
MRILFAILSVLAVVGAQKTSAPGGHVCNYPVTGDESMQQAVPIENFRTSGLDFIRKNWCVTHCADRKSVKTEVNFLPANSSSPIFDVRHVVAKNGQHSIHADLKSGAAIKKRDDDDFNFCIDDAVSDAVDRAIQDFDNLEDMSEALNYYVNKPGWAFMLYDMGKPPSVIITVNVKQDMNYCSKVVDKQLDDGTWKLYQVFAGVVQPEDD